MSKTIQVVNNSVTKWSTKAFVGTVSRLEKLRQSERGDAVKWVIGVFFGVVLLAGVYVKFQGAIDGVVTKILDRTTNIS